MKLNTNCGSIELLGNHMKKKKVNDEIIMKCLVTMILELLLQTFGMVHASALTQIQKTLRFFKNAQISRRNLSFWLKGLGCCFSNEV